MVKSKRRCPEQDFTPTHPNAAAIDIGSRMHVAAVPPDRDPSRCAPSGPAPAICGGWRIGSSVAACEQSR